jgi:hypothetical protein
MGVRAKFFVQERTETASGQDRVVLGAVCRGEDNKEWSKYTPSGQITMTIKNDLATSQFDPGKEFYVDFTEAPKGQEG